MIWYDYDDDEEWINVTIPIKRKKKEEKSYDSNTNKFRYYFNNLIISLDFPQFNSFIIRIIQTYRDVIHKCFHSFHFFWHCKNKKQVMIADAWYKQNANHQGSSSGSSLLTNQEENKKNKKEEERRIIEYGKNKNNQNGH